jgi:hypothetical protein
LKRESALLRKNSTEQKRDNERERAWLSCPLANAQEPFRTMGETSVDDICWWGEADHRLV